jgi:hypothetical protein
MGSSVKLVMTEGTSRYNLSSSSAYGLDGRCGVVVAILAYYAKGRGFDSRTVKKIVGMNMFVFGLDVSMYNMYVFTKKKYMSMY